MKLYLLNFIFSCSCFEGNQYQQNCFYIVVFLLILVVLSIYFVLKKNNDYKKSNLELKEKQKELQFLLKKETNNNIQKTDHLSELSHQLRTELNTINGITNILIDENISQDQAENLKILKKSNQNLFFSLQKIFEINAKTNLAFSEVNHNTLFKSKLLKNENNNELHFIDKQILLVEDNKINQMITKKLLEKKQIICQIVENGEDAVVMASQNKFDLILMDVHLPGINGNIATQQIRAFDNDTPIVALTAISLDENKKMLLSYGMNDVITKPFEPQNFYDTILLYI